MPNSNESLRSRAEARNEWGLREEDVGLLFAGSGWDRKGLRYAIQALERISNRKVRLLVAGAGKKPVYRTTNVRFLGPVSDIQLLFLAADIFVLPTVYDPFSNACLEALSHGLPVITTATNGFAEIMVAGVHGEVIDRADNVAALHHAIEKWLDANRRQSAREHCTERARGYTMNRNVEGDAERTGEIEVERNSGVQEFRFLPEFLFVLPLSCPACVVADIIATDQSDRNQYGLLLRFLALENRIPRFDRFLCH